jgi:hypothetical protein
MLGGDEGEGQTQGGTPMDAGNDKSCHFRLFTPSPIRWFERVSAVSPVFAVFSPRFARYSRIAEIGHSAYLLTTRRRFSSRRLFNSESS